eukprot:CAMPEP_0202869622 /NCGR_PEP_ID=MMETSP1391-20130828/12553_1 /ASSEMBLY_ACC=CAM_ASM_000867 /TAXON_ID=1034604 /ORGANISM="Chlamydomonas leiostraca, Strain SAG 11-49" /LENGTH=84 /DNA_ID=CAMNT_0049549959 /DNA_START=577 /DNA_END=832 /DNA_ORIENTATION=+
MPLGGTASPWSSGGTSQQGGARAQHLGDGKQQQSSDNRKETGSWSNNSNRAATHVCTPNEGSEGWAEMACVEGAATAAEAAEAA